MTSFFIILVIFLGTFAIGVLIGLKLNKETYHEGKLVIKDSVDGKRTFSLELEIDPNEINDLDIIVFKVIEEEYND